jgi:hypothetical protein
MATMVIEALIAALGSRFDDDETAVIERMLREYGGTIPNAQLIEEIGLALAIHRTPRRPSLSLDHRSASAVPAQRPLRVIRVQQRVGEQVPVHDLAAPKTLPRRSRTERPDLRLNQRRSGVPAANIKTDRIQHRTQQIRATTRHPGIQPGPHPLQLSPQTLSGGRELQHVEFDRQLRGQHLGQ